MWDITSIPPSATITNASLEFYATYYSGNGKQRLYNISSDTRTQSNASLVTDITSGDYFAYYYFWGTGMKDINTTSAEWTPLAGHDNLQDHVTNNTGWWAIGLWMGPSDSGTGLGNFATTEEAVYPPMCLWVEFEMTAPNINESTISPADSSTDQCLNTTTSVWIQHDYGSAMNLSWYWWNNSDSSWNIFNENTSVTNGTYYANNSVNWTEPCTTYYWYISVEDNFGNTTESSTFEYKTHCINPPTDITCTKINDTAMNVTWTPDSEACGKTNTTIYYQHGAYAPSYGAGTLAGNFSWGTDYVVINNLTSGQCYSFGLWSAWNSSIGTWHLSIPNTKTCCAAGGDYRISFYDEDTLPHIPIDFTTYPWNQSTQKLIIHYWDATEDEVLINSSSLSDCIGTYWQNISASQDVWYFELKVFFDWDETILVGNWTTPSNQSYQYPEYSRKLNTFAVRNYIVGAYAMDTVDFYITDRTTYLQPFSITNDTATTTYTQNTMAGSLVSYEYHLIDTIGSFLGAPSNDAFITLYEKNSSGTQVIIHQEYIDASSAINPYLIFEKDYLVGANCTDCTNITNFGIAPTSVATFSDLIIRKQLDVDALFGTFTSNFSFSSDSTHLYFTYTDTEGDTDNTTIFLYQNYSNASVEETQFSTAQSVTYDLSTQNNITYYIVLVVNKTITTDEGSIYVFQREYYYYAFYNITTIGDATSIEVLITSILGQPPTPGASWVTLISLSLSLIVFLSLLVTSGPSVSFVATGITLAGLSALLTGMITAIAVAGGLLAVLGFIILITNTRQKRLY